MPTNRVDEASYYHDDCYRRNRDTKTRNDVCDKNMLKRLKGIYKPTIRERMERAIVYPLIRTKARFGWGVGVKKKFQH